MEKTRVKRWIEIAGGEKKETNKSEVGVQVERQMNGEKATSELLLWLVMRTVVGLSSRWTQTVCTPERSA